MMLFHLSMVYHWVLGFLGWTLRKIGYFDSSKPDIRILNFHDIPPNKYKKFVRQIERIGQKRRFIDVLEFESVMSGEKVLTESVVLLTFDDGFQSNFVVAKEILNPRDIKALFFVVPDFVDTSHENERIQFIEQRFFPGKKLRSEKKTLRAMSWAEINQLIVDGHTIGSHTGSHAKLSDIIDNEQLYTEIVSSGDTIAQNTGSLVEHFAITFGNTNSMSKEALAIAGRRYRYVYSAVRGYNNSGTNRLAIRRETIDPSDSLFFTSGALDGIADFQYKRERKVLDLVAIKATF
jgi:peptidoglycan/xylan/chitin deacetylase (PgdA/CDA1 family)